MKRQNPIQGSLWAPTVQNILKDPLRRSWATYTPGFLTVAEADALFAYLHSTAPFELETPILAGKAMPTRRKSCAFGKREGHAYRYVGIERRAAVLVDPLLGVFRRICEATQTGFEFALCLLYEDGEVALGWHADDDRDMEPGVPIASLSLGAERDFAIQRKPSADPGSLLVNPVTLQHGSLLIMGGDMQSHYLHSVPARTGIRDPRINLTFRVMRQRPASPVMVDPIIQWDLTGKSAQVRSAFAAGCCHMFVRHPDHLPELHRMAASIGMRRSWFQHENEPGKEPHYDLNPSRRAAAVRAGAVEVDQEQAVEAWKAYREAQVPQVAKVEGAS